MIDRSNEDQTARGTILVAEDNDTDALVFRTAFARAELPYTVRFVKDGQEAIDYLEGKGPYTDRQQFPEPDLLVLDLTMPSVDGFYVLKWMRASGRKPTPAVVLASSDYETDKRLALKLGASDYRTKSPGVMALSKFLKDTCERWLKLAGDSGAS